MAKVVKQGTETGWKATIRCAQAICGYVNKYRVEGCFALIEITANDLRKHIDYEGDEIIMMNCPSCGYLLYPEWQLAQVPVIKNVTRSK